MYVEPSLNGGDSRFHEVSFLATGGNKAGFSFQHAASYDLDIGRVVPRK